MIEYNTLFQWTSTNLILTVFYSFFRNIFVIFNKHMFV